MYNTHGSSLVKAVLDTAGRPVAFKTTYGRLDIVKRQVVTELDFFFILLLIL
jgi:hypothetical protein